jgi:hypothetical protein
MEAACYSETSDDFQQSAQCYITDNSVLHNQRCENVKFYALQDDDISAKTYQVIKHSINVILTTFNRYFHFIELIYGYVQL